MRRQEGAWASLPVYSRSATAIRTVVVGEGVCDAVVKFVGLDAYEQVGGHVIRDLFSEEGDATHVGDPDVMLGLAAERLQVLGQQEQEREGWAWVEVALAYDYDVRQRYCAAPTLRRDPSDKPQRLAELQRQEADAQARLDACYEADDDATMRGMAKSLRLWRKRSRLSASRWRPSKRSWLTAPPS